MAVFRIDKTRDYTVMANFHLRDISLSLKAKGLLSLITAAWGSGEDFVEKCDLYSRALLEAGYYPICPKAHQSIFLHEDNPREHQLGLDMGQHIMGRCRFLVVCGNTFDEYVKSDIAYAESHHVPTTTLEGIMTVKGKGRKRGR